MISPLKPASYRPSYANDHACSTLYRLVPLGKVANLQLTHCQQQVGTVDKWSQPAQRAAALNGLCGSSEH